MYKFLPSALINLSYICASLVGAALLILAHGLYRRLHLAYLWSALLLVLGAVFSLLKGVDVEEALICLLAAALLYWTKGAFHRQHPLIAPTVTPVWLLLVSMVLICCVWLGFFAHQNANDSQIPWRAFVLNTDGPQFLRASLAAAMMIAGFAVLRVFSRKT